MRNKSRLNYIPHNALDKTADKCKHPRSHVACDEPNVQSDGILYGLASYCTKVTNDFSGMSLIFVLSHFDINTALCTSKS